MHQATFIVEYGLMVLSLIMLHELSHYAAARLLGYRPRRTIRFYGVGFEIPDEEVRSPVDAVVISLAPQAVTIAYIAAGALAGGLTGLLLVVVGMMNVPSSAFDFREAARFAMHGWPGTRTSGVQASPRRVFLLL